jgi:hypothetical protein
MNAMAIYSWFNKPQRELEAEMAATRRMLHDQQDRYAELAAHNERLQQRVVYLEQLEKDLQARETSIRSYAVDFKLLNVFSVERQFDGKGNSYTTMGWLDNAGACHEWNWHCNQDTHEELVKQFIAWRDS